MKPARAAFHRHDLNAEGNDTPMTNSRRKSGVYRRKMHEKSNDNNSGYCLPKDTKQLTQQMSGISGTLVAAIDKSNELRKQYIADQIVALYWEKQNTYKGPVGIYDMKIRDYAKESMLQDLLSRIQAAGISVLLFCHAPSSGPEDGEVETDISTFADRCSIIIANRFSPELEPYKNKLYCRDIFNRN